MPDYLILLLLTLVMPLSAWALNVGNITTFIPSDKNIIGKEIKNESPMGRAITVRVDRIDSPLDSGKIIPFEQAGELLLSPSLLMMPGDSKNIIKFSYQGKKDHQERYYRLTFTDEPVNDDKSRSGDKTAVAQAKAVISTILVVQPREKKLDYKIIKGGIINKGNASFRITAMGSCLNNKDKKECREISYVLPGTTYKLRQVNMQDRKSHLGLWDIERFISVQ